DYVSTSIEGALDVYVFLQLFFKEFPKYAKLDFHIAGESYAGHYIPAIASDIDKFNKDNNATKNLTHVNLESILIGNGLVSPLVQFKYYPDMACDSTYGPVLDNSTCDEMRKGYGQCASLTKKCYDTSNVDDCIAAQSDCIATMWDPFLLSGRNIYDVRQYCEGSGTSCYPGLQDIVTYSNRKDVKSELGVDSSVTYQQCNGEVYDDFQASGDMMHNYDIYIPSLLKSNIRVLVYAGDADFICNWFGCDAWTKALKWSGQKGFNDAKVTQWIANGNYSGDVRTFEGFTFLKIFGAGHL
ncbi:11529_t:CDS:2, partial [Racocetra persica]